MNSRQRPAKSAFADSSTGEGRFRPSVARGFNLRAPSIARNPNPRAHPPTP